jgi:hypothetical protein
VDLALAGVLELKRGETIALIRKKIAQRFLLENPI